VETEGHPTQDLIDELQRRGAVLHGAEDSKALDVAGVNRGQAGIWLFVPEEAWATDIDETPHL